MATKTAAKKTAAKKATAKKATAKKTTTKKATAKKAAAKKTPARKATAKKVGAKKAPSRSAKTTGRTLIAPNGDKRYVRRTPDGAFSESDDVGASLRQDVRKTAAKKVSPGQGDRGDQKK